MKAYASKKLMGPYAPTSGNPVLSGDRACLFQHEIGGRFYGTLSKLEHPSEKWILETVLEAPKR